MRRGLGGAHGRAVGRGVGDAAQHRVLGGERGLLAVALDADERQVRDRGVAAGQPVALHREVGRVARLGVRGAPARPRQPAAARHGELVAEPQRRGVGARPVVAQRAPREAHEAGDRDEAGVGLAGRCRERLGACLVTVPTCKGITVQRGGRPRRGVGALLVVGHLVQARPIGVVGGEYKGGTLRNRTQRDRSAAVRPAGLLVKLICDDSVLDAVDARGIAYVVRDDGKLGLSGVQVGLDALGVGIGPLVGLAVADEVVVGKVRGAVGVAACLVVGDVVAVGDGHELVGEAEVDVALVKVVVPGVVGVVPSEVHLAPLAVDLHGVPGVSVAGHAAVGDAGGVQQLGIDALVALAGALCAGEAALGRAVVEAVVVLKLDERPVVEPQGHGVLGAVRGSLGLRHGVGDDLGDRGTGGVVDGDGYEGAQVGDAVVGIHEVEVDAIGAAGCELESEIIAVIDGGVIAPCLARGVADALLGAVVPVGGDVHAGLGDGAAAGLGDVEGGCLAGRGGVVPLHGEGDAVLRCAFAMGVSRGFFGGRACGLGCRLCVGEAGRHDGGCLDVRRSGCILIGLRTVGGVCARVGAGVGAGGVGLGASARV